MEGVIKNGGLGVRGWMEEVERERGRGIEGWCGGEVGRGN